MANRKKKFIIGWTNLPGSHPMGCGMAKNGITGLVVLDDAFKEALKQALESASEASSRYLLNGACLDVRDKPLRNVG